MATFGWDETKRAANLVKHAIDILMAALIFRATTFDEIDTRTDWGEVRQAS